MRLENTTRYPVGIGNPENRLRKEESLGWALDKVVVFSLADFVSVVREYLHALLVTGEMQTATKFDNFPMEPFT